MRYLLENFRTTRFTSIYRPPAQAQRLVSCLPIARNGVELNSFVNIISSDELFPIAGRLPPLSCNKLTLSYKNFKQYAHPINKILRTGAYFTIHNPAEAPIDFLFLLDQN